MDAARSCLLVQFGWIGYEILVLSFWWNYEKQIGIYTLQIHFWTLQFLLVKQQMTDANVEKKEKETKNESYTEINNYKKWNEHRGTKSFYKN